MKAKWIYYPGDFELYLLNRIMEYRYERDAFIPPFWRLDRHYNSVRFDKSFILSKDQDIIIAVNKGTKFNIFLDNSAYVHEFKGVLHLNKGEHSLKIALLNNEVVPSLFVSSDELVSDESWICTCNDHAFVNAASGEFDDINKSPSNFQLERKEIKPISINEKDNKVVIDFGKETMIYVQVINSKKPFRLYFGESLFEVLDFDDCELIYDFNEKNEITKMAKACRYIACYKEDYTKMRFFYEYKKHHFKPYFHSDDKLLNKIYDVSLYTLDLNTREFFLDGIKRDRWVWSGDAFQSNLMSYYSFFDFDVIKRTIIALLGKEPYKTHINHIMDYSLYWIWGYYDYLLYSGDKKFASTYYSKYKDFIEFVLARCNSNGLLEGLPYDWVFVDWAGLNNVGEVAVEQMLLYKALMSAGEVARILGEKADEIRFINKANEIKVMIDKYYDEDKKAYLYTRINGKLTDDIFKYPNMFAILFDLCDKERKALLVDSVLLNKNVKEIPTPFMRFFEYETLLKMGKHELVLDEIKKYWGGMLQRGATSFWERYVEDEKEPECYSMYGRKYGKSLCHAWGASPLYLIGKYYIGLYPTSLGFKTFECHPRIDLLHNFEAILPLGNGKIEIKNYGNLFEIYFNHGECKLTINSKAYVLQKGRHYVIDTVKGKIL